MYEVKMKLFNELRTALWDQTERGVKSRESMLEMIAYSKVAGGATIASSVAIVALGLFAMINRPVVGGLVALTGTFLGVAYREGFVVTENLEKILTKTVNAAAASISPEQMAADLLKDTWFTGRVFTSLLIVELKKK